MSEISRKTWCGGCNELSHRHAKQTQVMGATCDWAVWACTNPNCDRAMAQVLKIGENKDVKDSLVGDVYVLKKDYFGV